MHWQLEKVELMKILVTGGCGFIGANFIKYYLATHAQDTVINLDALTYAGNLENLSLVQDDPRYTFVKADIGDAPTVNRLLESHAPDAVVNFAAESHVDRSVTDPEIFVRTNVLGTHVLLEAALRHKIGRFLQVSTDEVYGSLGATGLFSEATPLAPNSPYSASKTAADMFVRAYSHTFELPTLITRCSNNYGPYQFPEKLIPLFILNAHGDKALPLYGDGLNVRDWLYVEDHCSAIDTVLHKGTPGEVYNVGGNCERTNRQITETILKILGKPDSLIQYVTDRPGHDRRYAIDNTKIRKELGWEPQHTFETAIEKTVHWYLENTDWLQRVLSEEYRDYYEKQYGGR